MFEKLYSLNVNSKTEKKNGLTYLSWAYAWAEFVKFYPEATYEIVKFDGKPYYADNTGAMCYTRVTAGGITHEMWLPVMDGANKAMKIEPYEYTTKYGKKSVEAFTMFDVNKTLMRCLVKNLAMFGLGLYIYAGEDLPEQIIDETEHTVRIKELIDITKTDELELLKYFKAGAISEIADKEKAIAMLERKLRK